MFVNFFYKLFESSTDPFTDESCRQHPLMQEILTTPQLDQEIVYFNVKKFDVS